MKKLISLLILGCLFSNVVLADCNFSTGVTKLPDGGYRYSEECNLRVGKLVQDSNVKDAQIADLTKALTLKDLALQKSDQRVQLWMDTSNKLEDRITKIDSLQSKNEWLYFGLGALTVIGTGFMASQLIRR